MRNVFPCECVLGVCFGALFFRGFRGRRIEICGILNRIYPCPLGKEGFELKALILASASPRRIDLLKQNGFSFAVDPCPLDESPPETGGIPWRVASIAQQKARYAAKRHPGAIVLGADTTVCVDGICLGKPTDAEDAKRMLQLLSGRVHSVFSGVCVMDTEKKREILFAKESRVFMRPLDELWMNAYIATGEPMDKAGAYAIQGGAKEMVDHFDGEWENIVGLPIRDVTRILHDLGL